MQKPILSNAKICFTRKFFPKLSFCMFSLNVPFSLLPSPPFPLVLFPSNPPPLTPSPILPLSRLSFSPAPPFDVRFPSSLPPLFFVNKMQLRNQNPTDTSSFTSSSPCPSLLSHFLPLFSSFSPPLLDLSPPPPKLFPSFLVHLLLTSLLFCPPFRPRPILSPPLSVLSLPLGIFGIFCVCAILIAPAAALSLNSHP